MRSMDDSEQSTTGREKLIDEKKYDMFDVPVYSPPTEPGTYY